MRKPNVYNMYYFRQMQENKREKNTYTRTKLGAGNMFLPQDREKKNGKKKKEKKLYMYREMGIALHGICAYNWSAMFNKTERARFWIKGNQQIHTIAANKI